jgi:hypothetical protein
MNSRERAFRKQLLLVKGDALRMQVRMELGVVRRRFSRTGILFSALASGRSLLGLFSGKTAGESGWRRLLRMTLRGLGTWKSMRKVWESI